MPRSRPNRAHRRTKCRPQPNISNPLGVPRQILFAADLVASSALGRSRSGLYSDRKACTASTLAARAAGRADAITAAARMTAADAIKDSAAGICLSALYLPIPRARAKPTTTPAAHPYAPLGH